MSREAFITKQRLIIGAILVAVITIAIVIIAIPKQSEFPLSDLERISLNERGEKISNYLEKIDITKKDENIDSNVPIINGYPLDRYISYALEYSYNENDISKMSVKEIKSFLETTFEGDFDEQAISEIGISPLLLQENINYNPVDAEYTVHRDYDKRQIASIPVTKYIAKNSYADKDKKVFTVVYDKYTAENPYDVLPHLPGADNIKDDLEGKGKITTIKNAINSENANKITEPEKETTVEFTVKNDKLVVKSIK